MFSFHPQFTIIDTPGFGNNLLEEEKTIEGKNLYIFPLIYALEFMDFLNEHLFTVLFRSGQCSQRRD